MYTFFTDSDTDITLADAKAGGYRLISMPYSIDGKTYYPYEDYEVFDAKPYYEMLRAGTLPTTSSIPTEKYIEYFEPEFAAGRDIVYAHFSAKMSATFDNMAVAVKALQEKYPERKFYSLEMNAISACACIIVKELADLYKAGATAEELVDFCEKESQHFALYSFADDLKFFRRSGRLSGIAATMGTLLGVRPIIYMSADGRLVSIGKERGRQKAMERVISYVEELQDNIADHRVIITNSDAGELATELEKMLRERFGENLRIERVDINPTAGAHCGPDSLGVSFHAKHR